MVVLDFTAIVKFIRLFQHSLVTLHLALIHQDPNFKHSLTYIDGHRLFNDIVIHMNMMKNISFWIETVCLCNQQMENIIHSFKTGQYIFSLLLEEKMILFFCRVLVIYAYRMLL